ncbi:MAG: PD-(D/E)XK nuclease family protein, partial [Clostridia bacterium]|nr:PD-(D/E)XK nuclease family protein [Clostridia bacterium]
MIRFVCGRSGSGKSEYIMNAVKEAGRDDCGIILIVPEQQAVAWESRIARDPELGGVLTLEVLTFTRLCDRVAREYGGFFYNCASKSAKRLLMWAALESVRDGLTYYNNARSERLVPALLNTVKELHTYRVDAATLETAAASLESGDTTEELFSRKLHDIATVYSAYDALLKEGFNDNDDMPEHTASTIAEKGFFKGKTVFIDSFYSYTPAQRDIICSAMRDADGVTLSFSCPADKTAEPQFTHIREYFDRMKVYAAECGGCEVISLDEPKRFTKSAIAELERGIWDFGKKNVSEDSEGIKLVFAKDRYCEGDAAASEICRLVMDGAKYSDIAVIARSTQTLDGITDAALQEKGIPHYTARRRELAKSPVAQLIIAALRTAAYGWRREDILAIAKTGLMSISDDECDVFEKYINMWRIRGERAYALDGDFGMDPFGYKGGDEEQSQAVLDSVNNARRIICEPLSAFCEIFRAGKARAKECAVALYKLLTDWGVPAAISAKAAELRSFGYTEEAAECLRMWDALMSVLDTLATTIPDAEGDGESFAVMLSQIIAATDVGTIPTGIDEVSLGSADMMRTENPRHVIIIGAVDGEFPANAPADGILSETDRVMLEGCGIELSDSGRNAAGMELFWFYKAVSAAKDSVTVIIPRQSGGSACTPSMGVIRIKELFPHVETVDYDRDDPAMSVWVEGDLDRFIRLRGAYGDCARRLMPDGASVMLYGEDKAYDSTLAAIPEEIMKKINGDTLRLSQSKIDKFSQCPFSYAATYTIGIDDDATAQLDPSDTGTFVHKILEEFFKETVDMDFSIPEDIEREICDRLFAECVQAFEQRGTVSGRQRFIFARLRRSIV